MLLNHWSKHLKPPPPPKLLVTYNFFCIKQVKTDIMECSIGGQATEEKYLLLLSGRCEKKLVFLHCQLRKVLDLYFI